MVDASLSGDLVDEGIETGKVESGIVLHDFDGVFLLGLDIERKFDPSLEDEPTWHICRSRWCL